MAYHPFRHLGLKILSIALAGAIWLTVGDQRAVERTMRVPLEYHNLPAKLELMNSPPDTVEVHALDVPKVKTKYDYVVIGKQTVLVEPKTRKIIQVIE